MARSTARKTKKQIRWDASSGGIVHDVSFSNATKQLLAEINSSPSFIERLEQCCGMFQLADNLEQQKPTYGDYEKTLDDLESVASNFIDRLEKLAGHELEGLIDSAWYAATKNLPDRDAVKMLAIQFRQQTRVAQASLPSWSNSNGRTTSAGPLRSFIASCDLTMKDHGESDEFIANNRRKLIRICLSGMGKDHLLNRLDHYLN